MSELLDRLAAALSGRYTVERELGRGGMALVFLAQDLKHHRPVAIKVLRPELAAVLGAERFLREIETAAKLTHPHILPLHDSGEADGFLYYVMPYVEGESLRDRLSREKQLPLDDALQIAREVADALSYAHSHDVIHRDIKPENILFEAGHAVVTDFGIARAITAAGGEKLTETGIAVGTPAYMSPEQAGGSRALDGRSDLYALGCVLYEMLAGQPPFTGPTVESVVHQHLATEAPSITSIRPAVPAAVAAALARSLAKTPADRFNPVALFAEALRVPAGAQAAPPAAWPLGRWRWLGIGAVLAGVLAVALVRSFRSPGPGTERRAWVLVADFEGTADPSYFAPARDLVSTVLDQSSIVATVPREQLRQGLALAGKPDTTRLVESVALELAVRRSVSTVVTGKLDRVGRAYSVLLRLLDAEDGKVLLAETGLADGDDALIPTLDRVGRALSERLGERRGSIQATRALAEVATPSFAAYRKYAEAVRLRYEAGDFRESARLAREALELDPDFATAWVLLGVNLSSGLDQDDSAETAYRHAAERPDRLTEATRLELAGQIAALRGDNPAAVEVYERLVRENPNDLVARNRLANYLSNVRGYEAAIKVIDEAAVISPFGLNQVMRSNRALWLVMTGRSDDAAREAPKLVSPWLRLRVLEAIALARAEWSVADSLGLLLEQDPTTPPGRRSLGALGRASAHMALGQVRAAREMQVRARSPAAELLLDMVTRARLEPASTPVDPNARPERLVTEAVRAALAGDTVRARNLVSRLRADSQIDLVRTGAWPNLVEASIAAARRDWQTTVQLGGPVAERGLQWGPALTPVVRWLVADAYEALGQPDRAAGYLERLAHVGRFDVDNDAWQCGFAYSFAHQRLVVLYARMGRLEDARRHWRIFSATFTNPDPELVPLVEEAREALRKAERGRG